MSSPDMQTHYDKTPVEVTDKDAEILALKKQVADLTAVKAEATKGIVDHDFVGNHTTPTYFHAGSMGGQNVTECNQCGAMVRDAYQVAHNVHHGILNGVADYNGIQV